MLFFKETFNHYVNFLLAMKIKKLIVVDVISKYLGKMFEHFRMETGDK